MWIFDACREPSVGNQGMRKATGIRMAQETTPKTTICMSGRFRIALLLTPRVTHR